MTTNPAQAMKKHLQFLKALRGADRVKPGRLWEVKQWQAERLVQTYADVVQQPRFRAATEFFINDLYGPKDFSARDEEMLRIVPVMARLLPDSAVETAALAVELDALSEDLDHRLAAALPEGPIDAERYAHAYRTSSAPVERERQIALIDAVGRRLDALVKKPFVYRTLRLMRTPARAAGLGDLQDFLERGFEAFQRMQGADDFLALLAERETAILTRLFAGAPRPFSA